MFFRFILQPVSKNALKVSQIQAFTYICSIA
jgi:hypothetical protein